MYEFLWTLGIPALQFIVAAHTNKSLRFLSTFLFAEAIGEVIVNIVAAMYGDGTVYLYTWIGGVLLHHGLSAYLLANIFSVVRLRGLPSRQSIKPLLFLTMLALGVGFHFAELSASLGAFKIITPLDHALSVALGCMIGVLPFYCLVIDSSLPASLQLTAGALAIYEFSYAGLLGKFIVSQHMDYPHTIDIVYIISLVIWYTALRKGQNEPPPRTHPQPAEILDGQ